MNATEADDRYDEFDDYLDEVMEEVKIGSLTYTPSYALKNLDPIAYRCEYADYTSEYPLWVCGECGECYDTEEKAEECCEEEE